MNTDELILALQGEHELEYELLSELISVLEKIKDTEDDEKIEVIKKVLVFRRKVYDSGNTSYVLPQELEYLNDLYLQEEVSEEVEVVSTTEKVNDDDSAGDSKEKLIKGIDIYIYAKQLKKWDKDTADKFFKEDETLKKKEESIDKKIKAKNKYLKSINKQIEKEQLALAKMQLDFLILTK